MYLKELHMRRRLYISDKEAMETLYHTGYRAVVYADYDSDKWKENEVISKHRTIDEAVLKQERLQENDVSCTVAFIEELEWHLVCGRGIVENIDHRDCHVVKVDGVDGYFVIPIDRFSMPVRKYCSKREAFAAIDNRVICKIADDSVTTIRYYIDSLHDRLWWAEELLREAANIIGNHEVADEIRRYFKGTEPMAIDVKHGKLFFGWDYKQIRRTVL